MTRYLLDRERNYFRKLVFGNAGGTEVEIEEQFEIGVKLGTDPRFQLWILKAPKIRISYRFGDDYQEWRIGIGS